VQLYNYYGWPTGEGIRNHIEPIQISRALSFTYGAGVPKGDHGKIALMQEFGSTRMVTESVRSYMALAGVHLSSDTIAIHTPGRRSFYYAAMDARDLLIRDGKQFFSFMKK
jgi:hypothetical protein